MKTMLYYFTGTGNSLLIAKNLKEKLQDAILVPMVKALKENKMFCETQNVGFIFPLYFWGLPKIVEEFINRINLDKVKYIFIILNSGGSLSPDNAANRINKILKAKNKKLNASYRLIMPSNYIKEFHVENLNMQNQKISKMKSSLLKIADDINNNSEIKKKSRLAVLANFVNDIWQKNVNNSDKDFYVKNNCNSCGICVKICPVDNIKLVDNKPVWQHICQECLACIHYCPKSAIESKNTGNKGRYKNPEISLNDLIAQKI
jgi:heterodisulfide reductase subunit A-like polyferredoxin